MTKTAKALITALMVSALAGAQLSNFGEANPYYHKIVEIGEISPPEGTIKPVVSIFSPKNNTAYRSKNLSLNVSVSYEHDLYEMYYKLSWKSDNFYLRVQDFTWTRLPNVSIDLSDVPEGFNSVDFYVAEKGYLLVSSENVAPYVINDYYNVFRLFGSSRVRFIIDTTSPIVTIMSIESKTYHFSDIELNFSVNEAFAETYYILDGASRIVTNGNTTLVGVPN